MQNLLFGLLTGSVLAVAASGFALLRNTERFLHIAHGQFMALGALLALVLSPEIGAVAGIAVAVVATAALGVVCGKVLFDPVKHRGGNVLLFTSVGLAFVTYGAMIAIFGTTLRVSEIELGRARDVGPVSVAPGEVVILAISVVVVAACGSSSAARPWGATSGPWRPTASWPTCAESRSTGSAPRSGR